MQISHRRDQIKTQQIAKRRLKAQHELQMTDAVKRVTEERKKQAERQAAQNRLCNGYNSVKTSRAQDRSQLKSESPDRRQPLHLGQGQYQIGEFGLTCDLKEGSMAYEEDEVVLQEIQGSKDLMQANYHNVLPSNLRQGNLNVMPLLPQNVQNIPDGDRALLQQIIQHSAYVLATY